MNKELECSFASRTITEESIENLKQIGEVLESYGLRVIVAKSRGVYAVNISLDEEKLGEKRKRNAGRKTKVETKFDEISKCTVGELREMLKHYSKTEIMEQINCPKTTFYRIMKNLQEQNLLDGEVDEYKLDSLIWSYTKSYSDQ